MKILTTLIFALITVSGYAQLEWSGYGTCFALTSDGYLATNEHVISREGYQAGFIIIPIKKEETINLYRADIVAADAENDLAILKIQADIDLGLIPYSFKTNQHQVGEKVYNLGYPRVDMQGAEVKLNDGIINAQSGMLGSKNQYQTNIAVYPGNSGGPVIGINGNVIGVVNSNLKESEVTFESSVTWVIKTQLLVDMCERLGINLVTENTLDGLDLPKQVATLKHLVFIALVHDSKETAISDKLFEGYHIIEKESQTTETRIDEPLVDAKETANKTPIKTPNETPIKTSKKTPNESQTAENKMPEITEENILAIFESKDANVVIQSNSGMELDRFTVADYLKRMRLLKRHQPQVVDQKVNAEGKIIELIIKEKSN